MTALNSEYSPDPHDPPAPAADQPKRSTRKRVGKACDSCRIKKAKCDGRKPCSRCILDDKICTFAQHKISKEKAYSSRYVELLENRIDVLQSGMAELIRRVHRGDDISSLLSKSGNAYINGALLDLTSQATEPQKEEREIFAIVHDRDESEHDTNHEHECDHDHDHDTGFVATNDDKIRSGLSEAYELPSNLVGREDRFSDSAVCQGNNSLLDLNWSPISYLPVDINVGAYDHKRSGMNVDLINPVTTFRAHEEPMSPSSMTSASPYSSASTSRSPQFVDYLTDTDKSQSEIYGCFNDLISNTLEAEPLTAKYGDLLNTSTFMDT
ncbi:hypothetical protein V1509DRAFT_572621 [Lipomyces kononenkoae]